MASDRVYIGSGNTPLFYCLDAYTGKPLWIYKLGQRVEEATLCIYRDKVYVLAGDGYVHARQVGLPGKAKPDTLPVSPS